MVHSRSITINGIATREKIAGEGPAVLLIHGWGANIDLLEPLALPLSRRGYRCYMIDLPGFGQSAEPPVPFSIFDYARFCLAYLDRRQLETVHVFGHSLGGRIGLILGADYGDRVHSLALSNSAGVKPAVARHRRLRLRLYKTLRRSLERAGAQRAAHSLRNIYTRRYGSADYQDASPVMRRTLVKVVNQDLLGHAKRVAAPTVLIWGDEDRETPLWMGETLETAIPDAALIVHAGAGHYAYLDFPDKTAGILDALFRGG